jgi:hypothetical protein
VRQARRAGALPTVDASPLHPTTLLVATQHMNEPMFALIIVYGYKMMTQIIDKASLEIFATKKISECKVLQLQHEGYLIKLFTIKNLVIVFPKQHLIIQQITNTIIFISLKYRRLKYIKRFSLAR